MALPTRPLGRTGLPVTTLGFGSAPLGDLFEKLDDTTAIGAVAEALKVGITLFDTSPHYGNGLAEHRFGTALRRAPRDSYVISTKIGRTMDPRSKPVSAVNADVISPGFAGGLPHKASCDYSFDGAMRSFEQSLLRLGTDRIDIVLIHDADVWTHGKDADKIFGEAMKGAYKALETLRSQKVVKAIGVGINEVAVSERFAREGDFDTILLAGRYSLLEQPAIETFLPLAVEKKIGIMLGGVFNSGILATGAVPGAKYDYREAPPEIMDKVRRIEAVCKAHGVALVDAASQFPLGHPAVASVVLGAVKPSEVERNVKSFSAKIPAQLWADLKSEKLLDPAVPVPA
jgi:D-threo-aldose 1-dehydrogenase